MKGIASNTSFLPKTHTKNGVAVMNRDESHRQGRGLSFPPGTSSAVDYRTRAAGTPGTFDDCAEFRQSSDASPFLHVLIPVFSITYEWQRNCAGLGKSLSQESKMLRIQKVANGQVVLKISGRLDGEGLSELKVLIESEIANRHIVLDLRELTLVDRETVRFLEHCDSNGIELENCPPYICEWIARQRDGK
jgi:hypothetical protein